MANDNKSREWLYKTLDKEGYNVGKDYAEFDSLMSNNADSRKWVFDTMSGLGYNVGKDYDEFEGLVNPLNSKPTDVITSSPSSKLRQALRGNFDEGLRQGMANKESLSFGASLPTWNDVKNKGMNFGGNNPYMTRKPLIAQPKLNDTTKVDTGFQTYVDNEGNFVGSKFVGQEGTPVQKFVEYQDKKAEEERNRPFDDRVSDVFDKYGAGSEAEEVWNEAEAQSNKEFGNYLEKQGKPTFGNVVRELAGASNVTGGAGADALEMGMEAFATHLKYHDLQKLSDAAWNRMSDEKRYSIVTDIYRKLQEYYPDSDKDALMSEAMNIARQQSDKRVYDLAVKKNTPKDAAELFLRKAILGNSVGDLMMAGARGIAGTTGDLAAREEAEQQYEKEHKLAGVAGTIAGFAFDPLVYAGGAIGSLGARGALALGGKMFGQAAARKFGTTLGGRLLSGAIGGGLNFGTYEAGREATGQLKWGGYRNPKTGEIEDYNLGEVGKRFAHGLGMGAATGTISPLLGNISDKLVRATQSTAGKMAYRAGELGVGTVAEGTIFSVPEAVQTYSDYDELINSLSDENSPNYIADDSERAAKIKELTSSRNDAIMDVWTDNMVMMAGFKANHLLKSAPRVIQELSQNPTRSKAGFETRLRKMLDGQEGLALTKDEERELRNGYDDLRALVRSYENYVKNPERFKEIDRPVPYNRFVELMQDTSISEAARAKMYYYLTGNVLPMSTITGVNFRENKDQDGNVVSYTVESFGNNGVVTNRTFDSKDRANVELDNVKRQIELNTIDIGERYYKYGDSIISKNRKFNAAKKVADDIGYDIEQVQEMMSEKPENLTIMEKRIVDLVQKEYDRMGEESLTKMRDDVNRKYGVDVDKAVGKEPNRRSEQEKQAVEEYTQTLYTLMERGQQWEQKVDDTTRLIEGTIRESAETEHTPEDLHKNAMDESDAEAELMNAPNGEKVKGFIDSVINAGEDGNYEGLTELLEDLDNRTRVAAERYIKAISKDKGVDIQTENNVSAAVAAERERLTPYVQTDALGQEFVQAVNYKGQKGYITNVSEDGAEVSVLMEGESEPQIISTNDEDLTKYEPVLLSDYLADYEQQVAAQMTNEVENARVNNPKTNTLPQVGDVISTPDGQQRVAVVTDDYRVLLEPDEYKIDENTGQQVPIHIGKFSGSDLIPYEKFVGMQNEYWDAQDKEARENLAAQEEKEAPAKELGAEEEAKETPAQEEAPATKLQGAEEAVTETQDVEQPQLVEEDDNAMPMVEVKDKKSGEVSEEPDFAQAGVDRSFDYLYNEAGLDRNEANAFVRNGLEQAKAEQKKIEDKKPDIKKYGTNIGKYKKDKADWEAKVDAAKGNVKLWQNILNKANGEAMRVTSNAMPPAAPVEAQQQESVVQPSEQLKPIDLRDKVEVETAKPKRKKLEFDEPVSLRDWIMQALYNKAYRFNWSDSEDGKTKGLGSHLGLKTPGQYFWLQGKDSLSPEKAAERMLNDYATYMGWKGTEGDWAINSMDMLNELLDVLQSYPTQTLLKEAIYKLQGKAVERVDNKMVKAETDPAQEAYENEQKDLWAKDMGFNTYDEWENYVDMISDSVEPMTKEEYEENIKRIAEEYEKESVSLQQNEQLNTENNGEEILQPTDARIQGGTEVLSGEQVHDTGRSEGSLGDGQGVSTSEYGEGSGNLSQGEGAGQGVEGSSDALYDRFATLTTAELKRIAKEKEDNAEDLNKLFDEDKEYDIIGYILNERGEKLPQLEETDNKFTEEPIGNTSSEDEIKSEESNVNVNPTDGQKKAGNYKKGHIKVDGFNVTIENPKGSIRRGTDANGREWEQEMHNSYGYIRGTEGVDGDHIDVFLSDYPDEGYIYVIDQVNQDGTFDEHKVMYGFDSVDDAMGAYLSNYEEGWQGLGAISRIERKDFKKWIDSSDRKTKPFSEYHNTNKNTYIGYGRGIRNSNTKQGKQEKNTPTGENNAGLFGQTSVNAERINQLRKDLADGYAHNDAAAIQKAVDGIQAYIAEGLNDSSPYNPDVDGYEGSDPNMLADEYIQRAFQDRYMDDDEDQEYIKTGIKQNEPLSETDPVKRAQQIVEREKGSDTYAGVRDVMEELMPAYRTWRDSVLDGATEENVWKAYSSVKNKLDRTLRGLTDEQLKGIEDAFGEDYTGILSERVEAEERRREQERFTTNKFNEGLAKQGKVTGTAKKPNADLDAFTDNKELRPAMNGVYYDPDGYAVASDGFILIADKTQYDKKNKGKIVLTHKLGDKKKGDVLENDKFPKWRTVIPSKENLSSAVVNWNKVRDFLAGAEEALKARWQEEKDNGGFSGSFASYKKDSVIGVKMPTGETNVYNYSNLCKFADAASRLGINEISYAEEAPLLAEGKNGVVLMQPMSPEWLDKDVYGQGRVYYELDGKAKQKKDYTFSPQTSERVGEKPAESLLQLELFSDKDFVDWSQVTDEPEIAPFKNGDTFDIIDDAGERHRCRVVNAKEDRWGDIQVWVDGYSMNENDYSSVPSDWLREAKRKAEKTPDERLLEDIDNGEKVAIQEYDRRHFAEYAEETNAYWDMLEREATNLDDAYSMFNDVYSQWKSGGYKTAERTKLLAQMDALQEYIDKKEMEREEEEERAMVEQEAADAEQAKTKKIPKQEKHVAQQEAFEQQKKEIRELGYDLTKLRLRPLKKGETSHVERRYAENGSFGFTGTEHIESTDDVAFIFRQLQNAAVENAFVVLVKDGVPTVVHVGMGSYLDTVAAGEQAFPAFKELNPDKVFFVHNHPSGKLVSSKEDRELMKNMQAMFGDKMYNAGIIIDTTSGKYGLFDAGGDISERQIDGSSLPEGLRAEKEEMPVKVFSFSQQVFDADWNPATAFKMRNAANVAEFISSHRLGEHKKMSLLVLTNDTAITGNVFLPWTNMEDASTDEAADMIANYMHQMGGTCVLLYGNTKNVDDVEYANVLKKKLGNRKCRMIDVVRVNDSMLESGVLKEPEMNEQPVASQFTQYERDNAEGNVQKNGGLVKNEAGERSVSPYWRGALHALGKLIGRRVVVLSGEDIREMGYDPKGINGLTDGNTIYLNEDIVGNNEAMLAFVQGHEITHILKKENPELWDAYVSAVKAVMGDKFTSEFNRKRKRYDSFYDAYNKRHPNRPLKNLTDAQIEEEICANWSGRNVLKDKESVKKIIENAEQAGADPVSLTQKILDYIKQWIADLKQMLNNAVGNKDEIKEKLDLAEKAKQLWQDMYNVAVARQNAKMEAAEAEEASVRFSLVYDPIEVARLESEPKEVGYRNVVLNEDGTLGSPMADKLGKKGEKSKRTSPFEMGRWEKADEHPELANENGKIDLVKPDNKKVGGVDYNPYIHIRPDKVNKQFKQAWERPNLVYVETQYPESELTSGYQAEKAKKSVGLHDWNGGKLILSRWDKPVRIVPWEEVADDWVKEFKDRGVEFDIVPPAMLPILSERGVEILPPHKGMGKECVEAYEEWKNSAANTIKNDGNRSSINDIMFSLDSIEKFKESENKKDKYEGQSSNELYKSLISKEGEVDYEKAMELARRILSGETSLSGEVGSYRRGTQSLLGTAAEIVARRSVSGVQENIRSRRGLDRYKAQRAANEKIMRNLISFAKQGDILVEEVEGDYDESRFGKPVLMLNGKPLTKGAPFSYHAESTVFMSEDGNSVIKKSHAIGADSSNTTIADRLHNMALFNEMFPDTPLELIGIRDAGNGNCELILRQNRIRGTELARLKNPKTGNLYLISERNKMLDKFMEEVYGLTPSENDVYSNGIYDVDDVRYNHENVIVDENGRMFVIDGFVRNAKNDYLGEILSSDVDFVDRFDENESLSNQPKFSLADEENRDQEYADAVAAGDMEKALSAVELAAKMAMPNTKVVDKNGEPMVVYHQTGNDFTVFDPRHKGAGTNDYQVPFGIFMKPSARSIGVGGDKQMALYANIRKPLRVANRQELSTLLKSRVKGYKEALAEYEKIDKEYSKKFDEAMKYDHDIDVENWNKWKAGEITEEEYQNAISDTAEDVVNQWKEAQSKPIAKMKELVDNYFKDSEYDGIWIAKDEGSLGRSTETIIAFEPNQVKSAGIEYDDNGNLIPLSERFSERDDIRFSLADEEPFYSNAEKAVENIKQEKATPEQWLKMIEKNGGLKAGEDKWMGLSDWLKENKSKTLTKDEVLDYIRQNEIQIEEVDYGELGNVDDNEKMQQFQSEFEELVAQGEEATNSIYKSDWVDWAYNQMIDRYGDDFYQAFELDYGGDKLQPIRDWDGTLSDAARYFLDINDKPINSTRLEYTTEGLDNKREIALVVPSIESWNAGDEIHFGDAGEGRAVAWVRFGDTTDKDGDKVLVIDEIQSKRHQEGREKGYVTKDYQKEIERLTKAKRKAQKELDDFEHKMIIKYDIFGNDGSLYPNVIEYRLNNAMSDDEKQEYERLQQASEQASMEKSKYELANGSYQNKVPDAPFDKNWHELAMKRMLRYAAENGYDKVAWTKGEQQAERYSLGKVYNSVEREDNPSQEGKRFVFSGENLDVMRVDDEGKVISSTIGEADGKKLSDLVGKDLAGKMMSMENGDMLDSEELRIGGEGMKGFYDQILPRFMDKYGKKWGVKTGEVELPDIGDQTYKMNADGKMKKGLTMWSVDVTPEMKESVMEGQPMFSLADEPLDEYDPVRRAEQIERRKKVESVRSRFDELNNRYNGKKFDVVDYESLSDDDLLDIVSWNKESRSGLKEDMDEMREYFNNKKILAFHNPFTNKITIFADRIKPEKIDETFFHENVHGVLQNMYGEELRDIAEHFWDVAPDEGLVSRSHVKNNYEEELWKEELFTYWLSKAMVNGDVDSVLDMLSDEDKDVANNILNTIGYDKAKERQARISNKEAVGLGETAQQDGSVLRPSDRQDTEVEPKFSLDEGESEEVLGFDNIVTKATLKTAESNKENLNSKIDAIERVVQQLEEKMRKIKEGMHESPVAKGAVRAATSAQKVYDRSTVMDFVEFAKVVMDAGMFDSASKGEVKRLMNLTKGVVGKEQLEQSLNAVADLIIDHSIRESKNLLKKQLSTKGTKLDAKGVEVQGKLDIEGQRVMAALKDGMKLDKESLQTRLADAIDRMGSDNEVVANNAASEYQGLMLAKQYLEDIKDSEAEESALKHEFQLAKDSLKEGEIDRQSFKEFEESFHENIRQIKMERIKAYENLVSAVGGNIARSFEEAKAFKEAEIERIKAIQHNANSDLAGKSAATQGELPWTSKLANAGLVRFFLQPVATFDEMLRFLGKKSADGRGYLWNRFMTDWTKATNNLWKSTKEAHDELDNKVKEIFAEGTYIGKDGKEHKFPKIQRWSDLFSLERKMEGADVEYWDDGKKTYHLSEGKLLYIYMVDKMSDGKMKLRKMGITEEDVDAIKEHLNPSFIKLADWIQDEFLPKRREKYNEVYKRMFGADMAAIDNYFPLKIDKKALNKEEDLSAYDGRSDINPATITGSVIKRTKNASALDLMHADAFDLVLSHVDDMERWAAFAEFNRDLNTLLSYKRFRNQLQNMSSGRFGAGDTLLENFKTVAAIAGGAYRPHVRKDSVDSTMVNLAKGVTAAKISLRVYTALKQLLSYPAYLSEANLMELVKSSNPVGAYKAWNWAMENLPLYAERWQSRQAGDYRLKETDMDWQMWKNDLVRTAARVGMSPNAFVDALTVAMGAKAVYETARKRYLKDGFDAETAKEKAMLDASVAYNETQQSSQSAYMSAMQLDRTAASVALTVFRNASMAYERRMLRALSNMKKRMNPDYKDESKAFMQKMLEREGVNEEEAKKASERMYRRQTWRDMVDVAVFGYILQAAWNLAPYLPYLIAGDDDDEKEKMLEDALRHAMFGGIEGLTGGSLMSEVGNLAWQIAAEDDDKKLQSLKQRARYQDFNLLPLMSDLQSVMNKSLTGDKSALVDGVNLLLQSGIGVNPQTFSDAVVATIDAFNGDLGAWKEFAYAVARIMQTPSGAMDMLYIDELGMFAHDARKLRMEDLAKRWARYKMMKDNPLLGWAYSEEEEKELEEKLIKRFENKVKERIADMDDEEVERMMIQSRPGMEQEMLEKEMNKRYQKEADELDGEELDNAYDNAVLQPERKVLSKDIAKEVGASRDSYGAKPQNEYERIYQDLRTADDVREDAQLLKMQEDAKTAGDEQRVKEISTLRSKVMSARKGLGMGNDEAVMQMIRENRKNLIEKLEKK